MPAGTHTVRSLHELKKNPERVLLHLRRSGKPVLITENGEPQIVLIGLQKRRARNGAQKIEKLIAAAEADVAAGRLEDFDRFMKRLRNKYDL